MYAGLRESALNVSSFMEAIKNSLDSPQFLIFCGLAGLAILAIIVFLILLSLRFKLTLYLGNGKVLHESHSGNRVVELQDPPPREGYVFEGWYEDAQFTRKVEKVFRMPMRGASLYAKWSEVSVLSLEEKKESQAEENILPAEEIKNHAEDASASVEETKAAGAEQDEDTEAEQEDETGEGDEIEGAVVTTVTGSKVFVQYRRSFTARLIQADDETKGYYNKLRNEFLSLIGVKERVSWNYDSFNLGRRQFAKLNANTKSIILYLALETSEIEEKYNFRDVSGKKRYAAVPVRYKITGSRSFRYACELIEKLAQKNALDFKRVDDTQDIPYETREALIKRKLIKVYAKRDTGETVTEEQLDEMIAEGATVEKLSAFTVTDKVSVSEADSAISDATAEQLIALAESRQIGAGKGRRAIVNLDTISANYQEGDTVDLESLKKKGLIDGKAASCKILARGSLDKSLTVEAVDFSLPAVKMIALTGGKVVKLRRN